MSKKTIPVYEFLLNAIFSKFDVKTAEGKHAATNEIVKVLADIQHAVERSHYMQHVAEKLQVKEEMVEQELEKYLRKMKLQTYQSPRSQYQERSQQQYQHSQLQKQQEKVSETESMHEVVEWHVLKLLLQADAQNVGEFAKELDPEWITTPTLQKLLVSIIEFSSKQQFDISKFSAKLPEELQTILSELYLSDTASQEISRKEWDQAMQRLQEKFKTAQMQNLSNRIAELEKIVDRSLEQEAELTEMLNEFKQISSQLNSS